MIHSSSTPVLDPSASQLEGRSPGHLESPGRTRSCALACADRETIVCKMHPDVIN